MKLRKLNSHRNAETDRENLLFNSPANSRYAEAYRTMRANLFFSRNDLDSFVVTSAVEKEGKTTTAINLAYTIAQTDRKVLLVDCDLRRPHLTTLVTGKVELGVTELITDIFGLRLSHGSLKQYSVNDLVALTGLQKRSGCLDIADSETQVTIAFEKGVIRDVSWKNRPDSDKLITTLIRKQLLSEKDARTAISHQKRSDRRLGSILCATGLVSKEDLSKVLVLQAIEAIRALGTVTEGTFVFSSLAMHGKKSDIDREIDYKKLYEEYSPGDNDFTYLSGAIDRAIHPTDTENLFVLPAGKVPPNPAELAGSERMGFLIQALKKQFDVLVIDTPPVTPATDAVLIAPRTNGTVFVIKSGNTERKIIEGAVEQYKSAHLPIIGTVLNQVDMKKEGYYRYYQKYYSSYYGK